MCREDWFGVGLDRHHYTDGPEIDDRVRAKIVAHLRQFADAIEAADVTVTGVAFSRVALSLEFDPRKSPQPQQLYAGRFDALLITA